MTTKIKDKAIKRYRVTSDKANIIIDYEDNTTDVLEYSRELEIKVLEAYKKQILKKEQKYDNARNQIKKDRQFVVAMGILAAVFTGIAVASHSWAIPIILVALSTRSVYRIVKNRKTVNKLKKQITLALNVDKINKKREEALTPMDKQLGRHAELFNLSNHQDYTNEQARETVKEAGGNAFILEPPFKKARQLVKSRYKRL